MGRTEAMIGLFFCSLWRCSALTWAFASCPVLTTLLKPPLLHSSYLCTIFHLAVDWGCSLQVDTQHVLHDQSSVAALIFIILNSMWTQEFFFLIAACVCETEIFWWSSCSKKLSAQYFERLFLSSTDRLEHVICSYNKHNGNTVSRNILKLTTTWHF